MSAPSISTAALVYPPPFPRRSTTHTSTLPSLSFTSLANSFPVSFPKLLQSRRPTRPSMDSSTLGSTTGRRVRVYPFRSPSRRTVTDT